MCSSTTSGKPIITSSASERWWEVEGIESFMGTFAIFAIFAAIIFMDFCCEWGITHSESCVPVAREMKSQAPLLSCYQWSQVSQLSGVQRLEPPPSTDAIRFSGVASSAVTARGPGFQATPLLFPYFTPPPGDPLLYKQICEIIWYLAEVSLQSCGCFYTL